MSDQSQGAGWWLASDDKWYPPSEPVEHPLRVPSRQPGFDPVPGQSGAAQPAGWRPPPQLSTTRKFAVVANKRAVGGVAASGLGLLFCPFVGSVTGVVLGLVSRKDATRRWAPLTAIVVGLVGLLFWVPAVAYAASHPAQHAPPGSAMSDTTTTTAEITTTEFVDVPTTVTTAPAPTSSEPPTTQAPPTKPAPPTTPAPPPSTVVVPTTRAPPTAPFVAPPTSPTTAYVPPAIFPAVQQNVHPGAFCTTGGARGITATGTPMVCTTTATDSRNRWRAA